MVFTYCAYQTKKKGIYKMLHYYVNKNAQTNGDHEVHEEGCKHMPTNKINLGEHATCKTAVAKAKLTYPKADGCYYCCNSCHTS